MKLALFLLLFPLISWSETKVLTIDGKAHVLIRKDSVFVSENCLKSSCEALGKHSPLKVLDFGNQPAAEFCEKSQGKYRVGRYESGDMDGVCVFKDQSFILGWDLFNRFQKKK